MFNRALLPVDGSEVALAAVEAAVRVVAPDGEVVLVAVIPTVEELLLTTAAAADSRASAELADIAHRNQQRDAEEAIEQAARRVEAAGGRIAARVVAQGDAGRQVLSVAGARDCDIIVMSTNGHSGWRRAILGSVADYVVRNAEGIPVTLVRRAG